MHDKYNSSLVNTTNFNYFIYYYCVIKINNNINVISIITPSNF